MLRIILSRSLFLTGVLPGLPQLPSVGKLLHSHRSLAHRRSQDEQVAEELHYD